MAMGTAVRFQHWYPERGPEFEYTIQQSCSEPYRIYLHPELCHQSPDGCTYLPQRVLSCILENADPPTLADTAAAAVILGLLPTVLSFAGSSTIEIGVLATQRPILALLLAAASPATNPLRSSDFRGAVKALTKHEEHGFRYSVPQHLQGTVSLVQYLLAMANIVNLITTLAELSIKSVCSVSITFPYLFGIWATIGLVQYMLGTVCLSMAVQFRSEEGADQPKSISSVLRHEMRLCGSRGHLRAVHRKTTFRFICLEWCTSLLVICNIINGTAVFSSVLFVGSLDSLIITIRLLVSTVLSRMILVFELQGITQNIVVKAENVDTGGDMQDTGLGNRRGTVL